MSTAYLVDTNLLLRLNQPASPMHSDAASAIATLITRGDRICITPQNLVEFWSVATRPIASNGFGLSAMDAMLERRRLEQTFDFLPDSHDIYPFWKSLVDSAGVISKQVHDARLVAVCHAYGIPNLLTFNVSDFMRFRAFGAGIEIVHPQYLPAAT